MTSILGEQANAVPPPNGPSANGRGAPRKQVFRGGGGGHDADDDDDDDDQVVAVQAHYYMRANAHEASGNPRNIKSTQQLCGNIKKPYVEGR